MARVIKIDNALEKRFSHKKSNPKPREIIIHFLIVCEGKKTEPNYFKAFPKKVGKVIYDIEFEGGGISTLKVVEQAIELRGKSIQKYDSVWAVFDRDSFKSESFNNAIKKAETNNIKCAWSNEAFELWYLLHFHNRVTAMCRDEYEMAIEKVINEKLGKKKKKFKYVKNDPNMFSLLQEIGNQNLAIKWAEELEKANNDKNYANHNPSTTAYKLVEELIGESEDFNQIIIEKHSKGE